MQRISKKLYPFKFLDAYTKEDQSIFFGRETEVEELFVATSNSKLVVLHGVSGAGKTSLVQCGLAKKLHRHSWIDLYIRRGKNINSSLQEVLDRYSSSEEENLLEEEEALSPTEKQIQGLYLEYFRPIYLIFDQFEELFILGTEEEQQVFYQKIKAILAAKQEVKLIFSIREEYLAHLDAFEQVVPELFRHKIRVEPMTLDKVATVLQGINALPQSLVHFTAGQEVLLADALAKKLSNRGNQNQVSLPYLQVILDKLYRTETADQSPYPQTDLRLDLSAIERLPHMDDILAIFLEERVRLIADDFGGDREQGQKDLWNILMPFVTLEGTKIPTNISDLYQSLTSSKAFVDKAVQALLSNRILRYREDEDLYEVAHDSLALSIAAKRSDEEIELLEIKRYLKSQVSQEETLRELISAQWLQRIKALEAKLSLNTAEAKLVRESSLALEQAERSRRWRNIFLFALAMIIICVLAALSYWAWGEKQKADIAQASLLEALAQAKKSEEQANLAAKEMEKTSALLVQAQEESQQAEYDLYLNKVQTSIHQQIEIIPFSYKASRAYLNILRDLSKEQVQQIMLDSLESLIIIGERAEEYYNKTQTALAQHDWFKVQEYMQSYEQYRKQSGARLKIDEERLKEEARILLEIIEGMVSIRGEEITILYTNNRGEVVSSIRREKVNDFAISRFECTQEQWEFFMEENPSEKKDCKRCPVEHLSQKQVKNFIKILEEKAPQYGFRIPYYKERELIRRRLYPSDYTKNFKEYNWNDIIPQEVGRSRPVLRGIYDFDGNVQEWTDRLFYENASFNGGIDGGGEHEGLRLACDFIGDTIERTIAQKIVNNMIFVKGGAYKMGKKTDSWNSSLHPVELSDFYIAKYECTQEEWRIIAGTTPQIGEDYCPNCPVYDISWEDIQFFIKRLNQLTEKQFRLPTEAEWEYAARGGQSSKGYQYAGSNKKEDVATFRKAKDRWGYERTYIDIVKVGKKEPNELGIQDMSGNVDELCGDWFKDDYYKYSLLKNPQGPTRGENRVVRSGRDVYYRNDNFENGYLVGFRLVLSKAN